MDPANSYLATLVEFLLASRNPRSLRQRFWRPRPCFRPPAMGLTTSIAGAPAMWLAPVDGDHFRAGPNAKAWRVCGRVAHAIPTEPPLSSRP